MHWDALTLDARDYAILGSLPIRRRILLMSRSPGFVFEESPDAAVVTLGL